MRQLRQIRHEPGKKVVCLHIDTINSVDACNISRIMMTTSNVTVNATHFFEQVNCIEGTHDLVYVALALSVLLASFPQLCRRRRSTATSTERVPTTRTV